MVLAEDIVEPQRRLLNIRHRLVPREDGIGLATNKSPVDSCNVVLLQEWENRLEITAIAACHILGADHRTVVFAERINALAMDLRVAIVVVGDNIRVCQLELVEFRTFYKPYTHRERLAHLAFACPTEDIVQERHRCQFVFSISRFIVEVPHPDTLVVFESSHHIFDICLKDREQSCCVRAQTNSRVLHPARVVDTRLGSWLLAIGRFGIPAVVKENELRLDMMFVSNGEVFIDVLFESFGLVLPYHAAQVHTHDIEAGSSAHPNSRSIVAASKVADCHISIWLMAVLGWKLHPAR